MMSRYSSSEDGLSFKGLLLEMGLVVHRSQI